MEEKRATSINSERATEIQQALIREKYLTGEPPAAGTHAPGSLVKYQGDNGGKPKWCPTHAHGSNLASAELFR